MGLRKSNDDKKSNRPEWIVIYVCHDLQEAHIVAGKLQAFDIPAMVNTVPGASAFGITYGNLGEIKVLIHPEDYDRAEDILFPEEDPQLENNNDKVQYFWSEDGDGEYYIEDEDEEDD